MVQKTELLAPAKNKETAFAAIDCGADAVYIGASSFGARKNASNTISDIKEVVDYAHKYWAKVFVTLNTILTDSELDEAVDLAVNLADVGVDALIIQDLGLLKRLIDIDYKLQLHMSTQCDNYLPEKIRFFNDIGVSRVVLARETSIEQIKKIKDENPDLELEGFVHGALCVSMSGQCYLSEYIGGRSANRGVCAQPCRKKYSIETADGKILAKDVHALCLKDFNASNKLQALSEAGVYSFKIEGRLKDVSYVKNIVAYYRQKLGQGVSSGTSKYPFMPNPEKSFNRGFTEYFLEGRSDCFNFESPKSKGEYLGKVLDVRKNSFKLKTNKKISPQDGLYFKGEGCLVNKISDDYIFPNSKKLPRIGEEVYRNLDIKFEKELLKPVKRQISARIEIADNIKITDEDGICVTKDIPQGDKPNDVVKYNDLLIKQLSKSGETIFSVDKVFIHSEIPFMPISDINDLRRKLLDELEQKRIEFYIKYKKEVSKPLKYAKYFEEQVDYRANVHNTSASEFYKNCGAKVIEFSFESKKPQRKVVLMKCKHCIKYALDICKSQQNLVLRDEYNNKYPLKFDCKNCEMSVIQPS